MGQTAIISPQILDSSAIGRDLITAATVASAHTTLDLEDTAFSYSLTQTFEAGIVAAAITSATNIVTTLPSGGQGQYYFGANPIYLMSATEFRPAEALTAATLGSATRRWTNVYGVDGDFSGTVTANAFVGDGSGLTGLPAGNPFDQDLNTTDSFSGTTITATTGFVGDGSLLTNLPAAGNPFDQDLNTTDSPEFVDGSFTGTVKSQTYSPENDLVAWQVGWQDTRAGIEWKSNQKTMVLESNFGQNLSIADGFNQIGKETFPRLTDTYSFGIDSRRWSGIYSVDGSFSGNLDTEVGGSNRIFNLGSDADVAAGDTEYLELSASANVFTLEAKKSGAGVVRDFNVKANDGDFSGSVTTGGLTTGIQTVTLASDTLVNTDHTNLCDCTSNAITINLPTAVAGLRYEIKKIDSSSNAVTIDGFGSETIDGGLTAVINTQYESVTIVSDGTNWFIV